MASFHLFVLAFLVGISLSHLVFGQNQKGFISLDCGHPSNLGYIEPNTGIAYISDAGFIDTGVVHQISGNHVTNNLEQQLRTVRSFPEGTRNCYRIKVTSGTKYLVRSSFLYGNYDGEGKLPRFNLLFGVNLWDSVAIDETNKTIHKEIITIVPLEKVEICLVNIGFGVPFISALELRPLNNTAYANRSLTTFLRLDVGNSVGTYRGKDDIYDRIWESQNDVNDRFSYPPDSWLPIDTIKRIIVDKSSYRPAARVMSSAVTSKNSTNPLHFTWIPPDITVEFYVYMYFAEFRQNGSRFNIFINGDNWLNFTWVPPYLKAKVLSTTTPSSCRNGRCEASLVRAEDSVFPPILNALEIYSAVDFSQLGTFEEDVEAITGIKAQYGVVRNWQGDPCAPADLIWRGLKCSLNESAAQRITSLDLSSNGLTGEIAPDIINLKMLEILDLSNNSLSGSVPNFLSQLPLLRVLKLEKNNLSGLIPPQLTEKSNNGALSLSISANSNLFTRDSREEKNKKILLVVVTSIGGFVLFLFLTATTIYWMSIKGRKQHEAKQNVEEFDQWEIVKRHYSYLDIQRMTNNFERILGVGGFGIVYYGKIENVEVAVKMLSSSSTQGYMQFQAEVELLMRVHQKNLTVLVGYCNEVTNKGLVYEYMGKGNLGSLLASPQSYMLDWKQRLNIALDAARGLEYLHNGIKPAMVHRDVKSTNILLNDKNEAKVSDFGLSRISPVEGGATHVTTNVVGTCGYIDPEYYTFYRLTEKSDVYSYGVVLLEIITGRRALIEEQDETIHISKWIGSSLSQGDILAIIDPKLNLNQVISLNSVWKAVEIAMSCANHNSASRPNMSQVVEQLKECLAMELTNNVNEVGEPHYSCATDSITALSPR